MDPRLPLQGRSGPPRWPSGNLRRLFRTGAITGALLAAFWAAAPRDKPPDPAVAGMVIAHRGGLAHAPENTVEAVRFAHRAGAGAVELDVWPSAAGPLCAHDAGAAVGAPLLATVLEEALRLGLMVELDLKTNVFGSLDLIEQVVALIEANKAHDKVWVSAFQPAAVWRARRSVTPSGAVPTGLAIPRWAGPMAIVWEGLAHALGVNVLEPEISLFTEARRERWQRSFVVVAWTVADPARAQELRASGVAVIVDDLRP